MGRPLSHSNAVADLTQGRLGGLGDAEEGSGVVGDERPVGHVPKIATARRTRHDIAVMLRTPVPKRVTRAGAHSSGPSTSDDPMT